MTLTKFQLIACSLSKNLDDLEHLLKCANKTFDIVAVSETRITEKVSLTSNTNVQNYSFEFTPTESNTGETLLCIANHLPYKPRTGFNLNIANQLESTFIEVINSRKATSLLVAFINILVLTSMTYLNT